MLTIQKKKVSPWFEDKLLLTVSKAGDFSVKGMYSLLDH